MRAVFCWTIVGVALLTAAGADPDDRRADLDGHWVYTTVERDGERREAANNPLFAHNLRIKGDRFTHSFVVALAGGIEEKGTFEIVGRDKKVFQVDVTYTRESAVGQSNRTAKSEHEGKELWELVDKDTLRVCRGKGKDRPDDLTTKKGDGRVVYEFKRYQKKP